MLAEGFAANLAALKALQRRARLSTAEAAQALCVSPRTYRRWLATGKPDPTAVRLLAILAGFVPWPGWEDWEVHNGYLFPPGYHRGGIPPGEFFALVFYRQQVSEQRRVIVAREARIAELEAEVAALEERASRLQLERRRHLRRGRRGC